MIWLEKNFPFGAVWATDQDKFANNQLAVATRGDNSYMEMLMVCAEPKDYKTDRIILGVPDKLVAGWFADYIPLQGQLPKHAVLLVGSQTHFEKYFQFPEL